MRKSTIPSLEIIFEKLMQDSESNPTILIFKGEFTNWFFKSFNNHSCATASRFRQRLENAYGLSFEKEYIISSDMEIARQIHRETRAIY